AQPASRASVGWVSDPHLLVAFGDRGRCPPTRLDAARPALRRAGATFADSTRVLVAWVRDRRLPPGSPLAQVVRSLPAAPLTRRPGGRCRIMAASRTAAA